MVAQVQSSLTLTDVLVVVNSSLTLLAVFFAVRFVNQYDGNFKALFDRDRNKESRLSRLEGEHSVNSCRKKRG